MLFYNFAEQASKTSFSGRIPYYPLKGIIILRKGTIWEDIIMETAIITDLIYEY